MEPRKLQCVRVNAHSLESLESKSGMTIGTGGSATCCSTAMASYCEELVGEYVERGFTR